MPNLKSPAMVDIDIIYLQTMHLEAFKIPSGVFLQKMHNLNYEETS